MDIEKNRGSVWRKWDLHIHTPSSITQEYNGNDSENWEKFICALENLPEEVKVIGITDYYFIDGYKEVMRFKKKDRLKNIEKIFPILEFRIDTFASASENCLQKINLHILFNVDENNLIQEITNIQEEFIEQIKLTKFEKHKTKKLSKENFISEGGSLSTGFNDYIPPTNKVFDLISSTKWKEKTFLFLGYKEWSNLDKNRQIKPFQEDLYSKVSAFFSSNYETNAKNQIWLNNYGNKKLLHSLDIHDFNALDPTNYTCNTWIKANPTFVGLKQLIYEPVDRVKIQELKPEEKEDYQVIDSVKFTDNSFTSHEIPINQNLTTIIGGKSAGKSILLSNIAQTIDPEEVTRRLNEVNIYRYKNEVSNFQVTWRDGQENKKNEHSEINRKIIYIPQSYLNRLVDKKEDKTSIDDIIKNVLEQEEDVKNVFTQLQTRNRETEKTITQNVEELFHKGNDIKSSIESIKKIGDKKGIETEVKKLEKETSELKKKAGMTNKEIRSYNDLLAKIRTHLALQEKRENDLQFLENLKSQKNFTVFLETQELLESLSSEIKNSLQKNLDIALEEAEIKWNKVIESEYAKLKTQKTKGESELSELRKSFNPLLEKATKYKSLNEKIKKLEEEEAKFKEIKTQENNLQTLKNKHIELVMNIIKEQSKFFDNFHSARNKILEQKSIRKDQDLEFGINVVFEQISFQKNCINDIFDQRKLGQFEEVALQNYTYSNSKDFQTDIKKIIRAILEEKITLKNSYSKKEAITKVTQSWYTFDYQIKQNGDEISDMSPGKKSFVLLKLLIELDNSKCPILLDQPEDDLDNRSIYNDLVKFIKTKKKERQMIIATHNPNLVVGADSECVIVANQNGDKTKNRTFQFEYMPGALEDTFLKEESEYILEQRGIQEHVCDVLEGGKEAFKKRGDKLEIR